MSAPAPLVPTLEAGAGGPLMTCQGCDEPRPMLQQVGSRFGLLYVCSLLCQYKAMARRREARAGRPRRRKGGELPS